MANYNDMLIRIKNAYLARLKEVLVKKSNAIEKVLELLKQEGYIGNFIAEGFYFKIDLLYYQKNNIRYPVLKELNVLYKPSRKLTTSVPERRYDMKLLILSTSLGVITHVKARELKVGGLIIAEVK